ncbi:peptidyl-prolyl cis-trans isomerase-like 2 [Dipodascopsis tothii]|uniref:peptidyl-prolyl cis-trans isomerase-like 2 n=1 Tax=Dipodascopsis tothii TaxID=44089 RepID=UPI0034CD0578
MGKNTDKLYITHSEWSGGSAQYSGSGGISSRKVAAPFRRLPFTHCALSLQPFFTPLGDDDGNIFEDKHIRAWIEKHGTNPVTGAPLTSTDELVPLHFHKNEDGEYMDPITFKVFTASTHIVAVRTSGQVYAWDTIDRLNVKGKNWRDLVTDDKFSRSDIITIQDPHNLKNRNMSTFRHIQDGEKFVATAEQQTDPKDKLANINLAATGSSAKILEARRAVERAREERAKKAAAAAAARDTSLPYNAAVYSTGRAAASLTSTGMTPHTHNERALLSEEEYMLKPRLVKHKGYVRLDTSLGSLNLELEPEFAPRAVYNFIQLAKKDYYAGVTFHRNIRNFMIQGGDPTGTGTGGESYWGKDFKDETDSPLTHSERGIVSMANKGKNTNSSQFFITYRATRHLDRKHTIFGRVVGGMDVLDRMELAQVDVHDKPVPAITIRGVTVFVDPFEQFQKDLADKQADERAKRDAPPPPPDDDETTTWSGRRLGAAASTGPSTVGKYLKRPPAEPETARKRARE